MDVSAPRWARWMGCRAGTYIVGQAISASGHSAADRVLVIYRCDIDDVWNLLREYSNAMYAINTCMADVSARHGT